MVGRIGVDPEVLTFSPAGELMEVRNGQERKAPRTINVKLWQEVDFLHDANHADYVVDRSTSQDVFLQYQGTEQRGDVLVEKYEVCNYANNTTFYLHVDVNAMGRKLRKAIPFQVEADTPMRHLSPR
jgi:hypothetical protein